MVIDHTSIHKLNLRRVLISISLGKSFVNQHLMVFYRHHSCPSECNPIESRIHSSSSRKRGCIAIGPATGRVWMEAPEKSWLTLRLKLGLCQNVITSWKKENIRCSWVFLFMLETLSFTYVMSELSFSIKNILFGATKKVSLHSHFCPLWLNCPWAPCSRIQLCPTSSCSSKVKKVKRSVFSKYQVDQLEKLFQKQVRMFCIWNDICHTAEISSPQRQEVDGNPTVFVKEAGTI